MESNKKSWMEAWGASFVIHGGLIAFLLGMAVLFPYKPPVTGPVEVDLVDIAHGGGGGGGGGSGKTLAEEEASLPKISSPSATPTEAPPMDSSENEALNQDMHQIAPESGESGTPSSGTANDSGSGGGSGSGSGTGTGSGTGPGSGSGSGGGNGSGYGTGNGSGVGEGSGGGYGGGENNGVTQGPSVLSTAQPAYPESARQAGIEGTVTVGITIGTDGSVESAWVASSSGNGDLDQAAVQAAYGYRFVPAYQNGVAIECNASLPVTFQLN